MSDSELDRMVRKAQRMEKRVAEVRKELKKRVFRSRTEGGVDASVNGDNVLLSLKIQPEARDPRDPESLERLVIAAVNDALQRAKKAIAEEMRRATGGMSLPGL